MNTVLVIAVHPDDETLGCGGTLLKHRACGDSIHWVILTAAYAGNRQGDMRTFLHQRLEVNLRDIVATPLQVNAFSDEGAVLNRAKQIDEVAGLYGFSSVHDLGFPSMSLDQVPLTTIIGRLADVVHQVKPNIVLLPFHSDVHSDHRVAFEAAYSCTKSFRFPFIKKVLMMETMSETEFAPSLPAHSFIPNYFVDISNWMEKKIDITKVYRSEFDQHPFPRSETGVKSLAAIRGARAGCEYAESFMLLNEIC